MGPDSRVGGKWLLIVIKVALRSPSAIPSSTRGTANEKEFVVYDRSQARTKSR